MTSIHGVDPIVVNNIKVKTQKSVVIETHKTKVNDNQKEKKGQEQDRRQHSPSSMQELLVAVEELNRMLARQQIKLFFQIVRQGKTIIIQLTEMDSGRIVAEIMPERIQELLTKFNTTGFTINELI